MMENGRIRPLWPVLISILLALLVSGCSNSNQSSGLTLVDEQGDHPSDFLSTHPSYAVSETNQCTLCHGSDLTGGISGQSCFLSACHHDPEPNWVVFPAGPPQEHGLSAKAVPGSSGFVSCQICHAKDFSGDGAQVSCLIAGCHGGSGDSPHPADWGSGDTYTHTTTAEQNASVCAQCHLNGDNSPIAPPSPPAPSGTAPGCFNSTLCHGENPIPHPTGSAWVTSSPPQPHGNDAKAAPGATTGFGYCQICHGTPDGDFSGGSAVSCYPCHLTSAPHPQQWLTGPYVHSSTDEGNASVCAYCHYEEPGAGNHPPMPPPAGSTPAGCFNGTLCHATPPAPHPTGNAWWIPPPTTQPQPHGNDAKAAPGATFGFSYCQACHGNADGDFSAGFAISCYVCHGVSAPHPPGAEWQTDTDYTHQNTNPGNAPVCAYCHYQESGGGNHPPTPPPAGSNISCFAGNLCH